MRGGVRLLGCAALYKNVDFTVGYRAVRSAHPVSALCENYHYTLKNIRNNIDCRVYSCTLYRAGPRRDLVEYVQSPFGSLENDDARLERRFGGVVSALEGGNTLFQAVHVLNQLDEERVRCLLLHRLNGLNGLNGLGRFDVPCTFGVEYLRGQAAFQGRRWHAGAFGRLPRRRCTAFHTFGFIYK